MRALLALVTLAGALPGADVVLYRVKTLIDPASNRVISDGAAILVAGGRVLAAGRAAGVAVPPGARVVDFGERFAMPGLIDAHGHLYSNLVNGHSSNEALPPLWLAGGVTSVIAPGSFNPEGDFAIAGRIDAGALAGPRFFLAGEYLQMGPPETYGMAPVATAAEARLRIERWASRGAAAIKIYNGMKGDILREAVASAHTRGLRVLAHLGATTYQEAIDGGVDVIYHGAYALPEIQPQDMPPEAVGMVHFAPPEFDRFYEALASADLGRPLIADMLRAAARSRVAMGPTLTALEPPDIARQHLAEQQKHYSADGWKKVEGRARAAARPYAIKLLAKNMEFTRRAHEAGVPLVIGTDVTNLQQLPQFAVWREMELFVEAGLGAMDVLRCATINGAMAAGRADQLGSIEAGKAADFVVLDADPLASIANVRTVHRVVKSGVVYDPAALLKPLAGRIH